METLEQKCIRLENENEGLKRQLERAEMWARIFTKAVNKMKIGYTDGVAISDNQEDWKQFAPWLRP